ncbi:MAG: hypothetical protein MUE84_14545 [Hyphomonas sp.]|jgi:hypothetical protein|nr:hypothetical protein [Hyphomonas sp.]
MSRIVASFFGAAFVVALLLSMRAEPVDAKSPKVASCSKLNGSRCLTGAVRNTRLGQQVRLPGGTWVSCAGDCQDQLRMETVDFWYEQMLRN